MIRRGFKYMWKLDKFKNIANDIWKENSKPFSKMVKNIF